jgi:ATP-binding cassette, subfamily A (ABC1), member 3
MRALLLALNQSQIACNGQRYIPAGDIRVYGGPIFYLILQIVGLYAFLVAYDGGYFAGFGTQIAGVVTFWKRGSIQRGRNDPEKTGYSRNPPADVVAEIARTEGSTDDALKILHISKEFGRSKQPVVDDVTFGIKYGEVYASLGPNGAGKVRFHPLTAFEVRPINLISI